MYRHQVLRQRSKLVKKAKLLNLKSESLRKLAFGGIGLVFVCLILISNIFINIDKAKADSTISMTDALGQTDPTYTNPVYTSSNDDNNPGVPDQSDLGSASSNAIDPTDHLLFVSDPQTDRVLVYQLNSQDKISNQQAAYVLGEPDFASGEDSCFGQTPAANTLCDPTGLAYDTTSHYLYVSDAGENRVVVFDINQMETDIQNNISPNDMNASYVLGQTDLSSNNFSYVNPTQTDFSSPGSLAIDESDGLLFVNDIGYARVMVFDVGSGISNGMAASYVLGQSSFTGVYAADNQGNCTVGSVYFCGVGGGIAYDPNNHYLFVSDTTYDPTQTNGNPNRIMAFSILNGISNGMAANYVLGQPNFTSKDGNPADLNYQACYPDHFTAPIPTSSNLCDPVGLTYDPTHNQLFVLDGGFNRVVTFDMATFDNDIANNISPNGMTEDYVLGNTNFTSVNKACPEANEFCIGQAGQNTGTISFDPTSDQLFVSDAYRVLEFDLTSGINNDMSAIAEEGQTTITGASNLEIDGAYNVNPSAVGYNNPTSEIVDSVHHRLFVADSGNNRVLVYNLDSNDQLTSHTANYVIGQPDFESDPESYTCLSPSSTNMCNPTSLAYDQNNNYLFVADGFGRVLVYDMNNLANGMAASNVLGASDLNTGSDSTICANNNNDATASIICSVSSLYFDPTLNDLFVGDGTLGRIDIFNFNSGVSNDMAATYELGNSNFSDTTNCSLTYNYGCNFNITYDPASQELFVGGAGFAGTYQAGPGILVYDLSQGIQNNMAYEYDIQSTNSNNVTGGYYNLLFVPGYDQLFTSYPVGEGGAELVDYDLSQGISDSMAQTFQLSSGPLSATTINNPTGLAYDPTSGLFYMADSNRVGLYQMPDIAITTTSLPDGTLGNSYSQPITTTNDAGGHNFNIPTGSLPPGLSINPNTGVISGTPTQIGTFDFTVSVTGTNNYVATSGPLSITVDQAYNAVNEIGQYNPDNTINWTQNGYDNETYTTGPNGLSYPDGTALDPINHRLFVSDSSNDRVLVYQLDSNNKLSSINPIYVFGQTNSTNDDSSNCTSQTSALLENEFCSPDGLAYDSNTQRLYVADQFDNRVLVFDASPTTLTNNSDGENPLAAIGATSLTNNDEYTNGCIISQNEICGPSALTLDTTNNILYVADSDNARVLGFSVSPSIPVDNLTGENANYVIGQPDFMTDLNTSNCDTTQSVICYTQGLAFNPTNDLLYVADSSNNRIMVFNANPSTMQNGENAVNELGQGTGPGNTDYTDSTYNTTQNGLGFPTGLAYDTNTDQLLVDDDNSRILSFDVNPSDIQDDENADGLLGQFNYTEDVNAASQYNLNYPYTGSMAYDTANNQLFLADSGNNRVMIYDFALLNSTAPGGVVGDNYSFSTPIYYQGTPTFSKTAGSLPPGLTLDSSTGVISGDPTTTGDYTFTENLADNNGSSGTFTDTKQLTIDITGTSNGSGGGGGGGSNNGSGGSGSSNNGNSNNGGGSSGGTTKTPTKTPTTPPTTTTTPPTTTPTTTPSNLTPIDLDTKPPYVNSIGYVNPSPIGQVYTFTANNNTPHSVTIANVIPPSTAVVSIDGGKNTLTLQVGQKIDESVTPSGKPDISIKLDSIEGDKATFTFARIKLTANNLSTIPTIGSTNSSKNYTLPPTILLGFPWLLFILIALSGANFMYRAYKERRLKKYLDEQLAWAISLAEQKHNLVTLVSHYLRTPLTIVSSGIELALTNNPDINLKTELKDLTNTLKNKVDNLLNAINVTSPTVNPNPYSPAQLSSVGARAVVSDGSTNTVVNPSLDNSTLSGVGSNAVVSGAANFNASSMLSKPNIPKVLLITLGSVLALVGLTDLILRFVDIYNLSLITLLEQIAAMILVTVFIVSTYHSYTNDKKLRDNTQSLLDHQTELDNERNLVITNSLASLAAPLTELKQKLSTLTTNSTDPNTANLTKPSMNGIARFESMLSKFSLITMLKTGSDHALTKDSINLTDLVKELTVKYEATIRAKQLNILTDIKVDYVIQNKALLSVALDSLISNALKYSPEQQTVTISAYSVDNQVHLTVSDHGVGITKDKLQQIMQPFSRIEDTATDFNQEGIGLSLYMDDLIMKYLGGTIDITPTKPGHTGTTTSLLVPSGL